MKTTATHFRRCNQGCDAIEKTLDAIVEREHPNWHEAAKGLNAETEAEDGLKVYQTIRDSGDLPEDAALYLFAYQVVHIADLRARSLLESVDQEIDKVWEDQGLEDWRAGDPRDADLFGEFEIRCPNQWDAYFIDTLTKLGEHDLAKSFRTNRDEFMSRYESGFRYFHGMGESPQIENWISELVKTVWRDAIDVHVPNNQIGCRILQGDDRPVVSVFVPPVEIVGGQHDGRTGVSFFSTDLSALEAAFDVVEEFSWHVVGSDSRPSADPQVVIRGVFRGQPIELAVLQFPPDQAEPASQVNASEVSMND